MYTCRCMCAGCMCQGPISTYLSYLITLTIANPARCWSFHRMPFVSLHFHCLRFFYSPPSFPHSVKVSQCSIPGPTVHLSVQMRNKTSNGKKTLTQVSVSSSWISSSMRASVQQSLFCSLIDLRHLRCLVHKRHSKDTCQMNEEWHRIYPVMNARNTRIILGIPPIFALIFDFSICGSSSSFSLFCHYFCPGT